MQTACCVRPGVCYLGRLHTRLSVPIRDLESERDRLEASLIRVHTGANDLTLFTCPQRHVLAEHFVIGWRESMAHLVFYFVVTASRDLRRVTGQVAPAGKPTCCLCCCYCWYWFCDTACLRFGIFFATVLQSNRCVPVPGSFRLHTTLNRNASRLQASRDHLVQAISARLFCTGTGSDYCVHTCTNDSRWPKNDPGIGTDGAVWRLPQCALGELI